MQKWIFTAAAILMGSGLLPGLPARAAADEAATPTELPTAAQAAAVYLLDGAAATPPGGVFESDRMAALLDFVMVPKDPERIYGADPIDEAQSAYYQFDIETSFERLLQYGYSPEVSSHIFMPSSVRLSYWRRVDTPSGRLPALWQRLPAPDTPMVVRGTEHIEITPDRTTGTYYAYDESKTLILMRYGGRNVLISISRMNGPSNIGRKGLVLGKDGDWNYFYSGLEGTDAPLVGELDTYIYGAWGVTVFAELDGPQPRVRCASLKWLKAGWKEINMVRRKHIHAGMQRFAGSFKPIMESASLPPIATLIAGIQRITTHSPAQLKTRMQSYLAALTTRYPDRLYSIDRVEEMIRDGEYIERMTPREMSATLVLEYMKATLGRETITAAPPLAAGPPPGEPGLATLTGTLF